MDSNLAYAAERGAAAEGVKVRSCVLACRSAVLGAAENMLCVGERVRRRKRRNGRGDAKDTIIGACEIRNLCHSSLLPEAEVVRSRGRPSSTVPNRRHKYEYQGMEMSLHQSNEEQYER